MATDQMQLTVRCDEAAPRSVRAAISQIPGVGWILGDAMLVASELVTNAVRHSACREDEYLSVRVSSDGWLRICVIDPGGSGQRAEIAERPVETGGMGLKVVDTIASRWGTEHRPDGYTVWAELMIPA